MMQKKKGPSKESLFLGKKSRKGDLTERLKIRRRVKKAKGILVWNIRNNDERINLMAEPVWQATNNIGGGHTDRQRRRRRRGHFGG